MSLFADILIISFGLAVIVVGIISFITIEVPAWKYRKKYPPYDKDGNIIRYSEDDIL